MSEKMVKSIENELTQLFDLRREKIRKETKTRDEVASAKKDIQLLIKMFSEDVPSISVHVGNDDMLEWDARVKRLIYHRRGHAQYIENVSEAYLVEIRQYLHSLIKSAKNFYLNS